MPDGSVNREQSGATIVASFRQTTDGAGEEARPPDGGMRVRRGAPPPVNIRLSLPLLKSRFYLTVVGGRERRNRERLAVERRHNRVATGSNILFVVFGALGLYLITLGAFLTYAAMTGA